MDVQDSRHATPLYSTRTRTALAYAWYGYFCARNEMYQSPVQFTFDILDKQLLYVHVLSGTLDVV